MAWTQAVIGPGRRRRDAARARWRRRSRSATRAGPLTLLDASGLKVDGIAYTREQVPRRRSDADLLRSVGGLLLASGARHGRNDP